jgi:hypothetical protein
VPLIWSRSSLVLALPPHRRGPEGLLWKRTGRSCKSSEEQYMRDSGELRKDTHFLWTRGLQKHFFPRALRSVFAMMYARVFAFYRQAYGQQNTRKRNSRAARIINSRWYFQHFQSIFVFSFFNAFVGRCKRLMSCFRIFSVLMVLRNLICWCTLTQISNLA